MSQSECPPEESDGPVPWDERPGGFTGKVSKRNVVEGRRSRRVVRYGPYHDFERKARNTPKRGARVRKDTRGEHNQEEEGKEKQDEGDDAKQCLSDAVQQREEEKDAAAQNGDASASSSSSDDNFEEARSDASEQI